jgi:prepilin-type N-terminal cleavage/methylation domain-containing protein
MQLKLNRSQCEKGLKRLWRLRQKPSQGFTLIELLVAALIGALVTMGLLYLVVELTQVNQEDTSRTETQRDVEQAMDYISQDLREAVFVYDGACLIGNGGAPDADTFARRCPGIVNHIPTTMTDGVISTSGPTDGQVTAGTVPVLAFWRLDPIPTSLRTVATTGCDALSNKQPATANEDVFLGKSYCESGKTYTLVVYGIDVGNVNGVWRGRSRLVRYALSQFNTAGTPTPGYVDPTTSGSPQFQQWPYTKTASGSVIAPSPPRPDGVKQVLTDFLDNGTVPPPSSTATAANPVCAIPTQVSPQRSGNTFSPPVSSFYACIRGNTQASRDSGEKSERDANQEVLVLLTGNVAGRPGFSASKTNTGRLSPLQTRVLTRGILDKTPQ